MEVPGYVPQIPIPRPQIPIPRPQPPIHTKPPKPHRTEEEPKCKQTHKIRIAVIDTGFGYMGKGSKAHLCKYGHRDFTGYSEYNHKTFTPDPVPRDIDHGHGTNIVGLIDKYASDSGVSYCIVVLKFYRDDAITDENVRAEVEAIEWAISLHVDFINLSEGGEKYSEAEAEAVKKFIDGGGTVIAAAGNENHDLAEHPYYPAMSDPRVIVVGNIYKNGERSKISNYGDRVDVWEVGDNQTANGITLTGTSQAAAITTGKTVALMKQVCYK